MKTLATILGGTVLVIGALALLAVIFTYPTIWIVNYLFTPQVILFLFGVTKLTFWKAYALNLFCGLAFKSGTASTKN